MKTHFEQPYSVQIAFSVPKRRHKLANKRNIIKRRMREAFRHQKSTLYKSLADKEVKIQILIVYIAPEVLDYDEMEPKLKIVLDQITGQVQMDTN